MSEALAQAAAPAPTVVASPDASAAPPAPTLAETLFSEGGTPQALDTPAPDAVVEPEVGAVSEAPAAIDPASYELSLPEGFAVDDGLMTEARDAFAAAGVPADKAQSLLDIYTKASQSALTAAQTAFETQQSEWLTTINSMPEFQGSTREKSLTAIGKLFDDYGTPEAKDALNMAGVGNHPALVKFIHSIASVLSEGTSVPGGRPVNPGPNGQRGGAGRSLGQTLFPDQPN